jgi:hypothetical protein
MHRPLKRHKSSRPGGYKAVEHPTKHANEPLLTNQTGYGVTNQTYYNWMENTREGVLKHQKLEAGYTDPEVFGRRIRPNFPLNPTDAERISREMFNTDAVPYEMYFKNHVRTMDKEDAAAEKELCDKAKYYFGTNQEMTGAEQAYHQTKVDAFNEDFVRTY